MATPHGTRVHGGGAASRPRTIKEGQAGFRQYSRATSITPAFEIGGFRFLEGASWVASDVFCLSGQRPGLSAQGYLWPTCPCRSNLCRPYLSHMSTCRLAFAFPYLLNLKAGFDLWSDFIRHQNNHASCPEGCLGAPKTLADSGWRGWWGLRGSNPASPTASLRFSA